MHCFPRLVGVIPATLAALEQLKTLDLGENQLKGERSELEFGLGLMHSMIGLTSWRQGGALTS